MKFTFVSIIEKKLTIKDLCPEEKANIGDFFKNLEEEEAKKIIF